MDQVTPLFAAIYSLIPFQFQDVRHLGVSAFAIQHPAYYSSCDNLIESMRDEEFPFVPFLWGTFGSEERCISEVIESFGSKDSIIQIHLTNETMRRRRQSQRGEGEMLVNYSISQLNRALERKDPVVLDAVRNRTGEIWAFVQHHNRPNIRWILGVGLEDNYTAAAAEVMVNTVREIWPGEVSRNPLRGSYRAGAQYIESHSNSPPRGFGAPCIGNEDGRYNSERESRKFMQRYKACIAVGFWDGEHQGRRQDGSFRLPMNRSEFRFTSRDVDRYKRLMK